MHTRSRLSWILVFSILPAFVSLTAKAQVPTDGELALILIDMSGSMGGATPSGESKFELLVAAVKEFLDEVYDSREYALWIFSGTSATALAGFDDHLTRDQIRVLLDDLGAPWGLTPFAGSFCDAVDNLIDTEQERADQTPPSLPRPVYSKRVLLFTDGIENNTPVSHECFGPTSTSTLPWTEWGSWQWKIYNKATTGDANTPPPPGLPVTVILDALSIFDFIPSAMSVTATKPIPAPATPRLPVSLIGLEKSDPQLAIEIYSGVTKRTGGSFVTISAIEDIPLAGDGDDDGCVDIDDYNLLIQHYGETVETNHPADMNRDGRVNYDDYLTLVQNFGDGCYE